jgi:hypothetical protein
MSQPKSVLINFFKKYTDQLTLAGIILLGLYFRFADLAALPPGLHPSEAATGLNALHILDGHSIAALYVPGALSQTVFNLLQAASVAIFGNTAAALRYGPALVGAVSVYVTYLWVHSWFGKRAAYSASFLLAVTPWAVTISRNANSASLIPLFLPLTLWLFTRGFQTAKRFWFVLAGLSLGLGFYTYPAWRLLPLGLLALLVYMAWFRRDLLMKWAQPILISAGVCAVTLLPVGVYAVQHHSELFTHTTSESVFNKTLNGNDPIGTLVSNTVATALMFNVQGDQNFRQNYGGAPEFDIFVGIMFILGILVAFTRLTRLKFFSLLALFVALLLPEIFAANAVPDSARAVGALVPALALAALGVGYMLDRWYVTFPINSAARSTGLAAILVLLALTAYQGYRQYFVTWAQSTTTYAAYSEDAVAMSTYLNDNAQYYKGQNYLVLGTAEDPTVQYLTHGHSSYLRIDPSQINGLSTNGKSIKFLVSTENRATAENTLRVKFPGGIWTPHYSSFSGSDLYYVYEVAK